MHTHPLTGMAFELFAIDTHFVDATLEIADRVLILLYLLAQCRLLRMQGDNILQAILSSETHIQDESKAKDTKPMTQYETTCSLYLIHYSFILCCKFTLFR